MKAEWGARREFLLYESPDGEDQAYNEAMDAFTATYEKRLADHFRAQNLPPLRPNLIRDSMRRETLINDRCDRVNTMRRKQSTSGLGQDAPRSLWWPGPPTLVPCSTRGSPNAGEQAHLGCSAPEALSMSGRTRAT